MSRRTTTRVVIRERAPIEWRQLVAIVEATIDKAETYSEWQGVIVDRIIALGFRLPEPASLHRAINRSATLARARRDPRAPWLWAKPTATKPPEPAPHVDPTIRLRPATPDQSRWLQISSLTSTPPNVCGASRHGSHLTPLRCTLPEGHDGDHAMSARPGGAVFVRWAREARV